MTTQDPRYKHKPSEKHTLEEVLKSLQDLVRNDLPGEKSAGNQPGPRADTDRTGGNPQEAGGQPPLRERAAAVREDFAPVNPAAGPVNLDAVLRSLKDLVGNELNVGDQSPPEEDPAPPVPDEDVLESAAEALAPLHEEPTFEEPDEFIPGDEPAPAEEDLTPPLPEEDLMESASEELAPLHQEPGFEEPGDLAAPGEDLAPPLPEENILQSAVDELAPLHEVPTFEKPDDLDPEDAPTPPQEPASVDQPVVEEKPADEFVPLDEELTFDETVAAAPPPAAAPSQELPGDISPELLAEPVAVTPAAKPEAAGENKSAPGTQQEIPFDEPAPFIIERQPPVREAGQNAEAKPEPEAENPAPEIPGEPAAQNQESQPEEALPTIEVEETFDDSAYFDVEAPLAKSPEEEIVAPAVEPPAATEATAPSGETGGAEKSVSGPDAAPAPEAAPPETGLKLELVEEPAGENQPTPATVDFDSIDLTPPVEPPAPPAVSVESAPTATEPPKPEHGVQSMPSIDFETVSFESGKPAPSSPPEATPPPAPTNEPPAAAETPAAPEPTPEVTMTKKPSPDEIKPEPEKAPTDKAAARAPVDEKRKPASTRKSKPAAKPPAFNLDDIPVLHEVVAPPAGGMLTPPPAPPAPLPAPDRARDIVVRAVAKLNVEMRKSGGAGLDTKTILRLQKLMRQELEKDGKK